MKTKIIYFLPVAILLVSGITNAENIVIDFDNLPGYGDIGSDYLEDGYLLTTSASFENTLLYGEHKVVLLNMADDATITLTKNDGGSFELLSMDVSSGPSQDITFVGTKINNNLVYSTISLSENMALQTYYFDNFENLVSVSWLCDPTGYDNIHIIPEPSSLILFVGSILLYRQRKNVVLKK